MSCKVLVVDDDPWMTHLLAHHLKQDGHTVLCADCGFQALELYRRERPGLVLTDWRMPSISGVELCRAIRAQAGDQPVYCIMLTAVTDEDQVVEALDAGADDYVYKPFRPRELLARLRAGERIVALQTEVSRTAGDLRHANDELAAVNLKLSVAIQRLERLARTDMLTGLANRAAGVERLEECWAASNRDGAPLSVLMLDLDHFKSINDRHGHAVGDYVLKTHARILRHEVRAGELTCRFGGEEFLIVCPNTQEESAANLAERLRQAIESYPLDEAAPELRLTISVGVAQRSADMAGPDRLIKAADDALYAAKRAGRNRVCRASEQTGGSDATSLSRRTASSALVSSKIAS